RDSSAPPPPCPRAPRAPRLRPKSASFVRPLHFPRSRARSYTERSILGGPNEQDDSCGARARRERLFIVTMDGPASERRGAARRRRRRQGRQGRRRRELTLRQWNVLLARR